MLFKSLSFLFILGVGIIASQHCSSFKDCTQSPQQHNVSPNIMLGDMYLF